MFFLAVIPLVSLLHARDWPYRCTVLSHRGFHVTLEGSGSWRGLGVLGVCQEALPESDRGDVQLTLSIVSARLPSHRRHESGAKPRVARPTCDKIPSHKPVVSSS